MLVKGVSGVNVLNSIYIKMIKRYESFHTHSKGMHLKQTKIINSHTLNLSIRKHISKHTIFDVIAYYKLSFSTQMTTIKISDELKLIEMISIQE